MVRVPRRLRKLNLDVQGAEHVEGEEGNLHYNFEEQDESDKQHNDDNLHLHLDVQDGGNEQLEQENSERDDDAITELPSAIKRSINIIFPNGEVRQILGNFNVKNMEQLKNGKVIMETDENGVPNDRSGSLLGSYLGKMAQNSTFAPLHIPKWDDDLFVEPQKSIVAQVETKFVYPSETKLLTRDWVLMKVDKGWRSYKHRLKDKYYNPNVRTLSEISEGVPKGVNAIQWIGLLAIWGQDKHKKLCEKNSECAKQ